MIKVDATTINPIDRINMLGVFNPVPLPAAMGLEGTGKVVEAKGENVQHLIGKRVSFLQTGAGTWA